MSKSLVEMSAEIVTAQASHSPLTPSYLRQQRPGHTLQPTALVHDAYLKLVRNEDVEWQGRAHFFAVAAKAMRQILINHARDKRASKRGGGAGRVTLAEHLAPGSGIDVDLLALDEALDALEALDERQSRMIELRFFGGLNVDETAYVLGVSPRTLRTDWNMARAWLFRRLFEEEPA